MMYEEARGEASPWCGYLRDLPTDFDTLIYWSENELNMLQASTIRSKFTFRELLLDWIRPQTRLDGVMRRKATMPKCCHWLR